MGNQCCLPKEYPSGFKDAYPMHGEDFNLKCQICKEDISHENLGRHLDLEHYGLSKQQQNNKFTIICLLCEFQSVTPEAHQKHLKIRHKYLTGSGSSTGHSQRQQTNRELKSKVNEITKFDIGAINNNQAQINGETYGVASFQKQYGAVEFDNERAKGDLVWRYVFTKYHSTHFYLIDYEAEQKSILGKSQIFFKV